MRTNETTKPTMILPVYSSSTLLLLLAIVYSGLEDSWAFVAPGLSSRGTLIQRYHQRRIVASKSLFANDRNHRDNSTPSSQSRRRVLEKALLTTVGTGSGAFSGLATVYGQANAYDSSSDLLVDVPMIRLKLPRNVFGREYVAIPLEVQGMKEEFMVDTGLTTEMITPHLQQILSSGSSNGKKDYKLQGIGAGGSASTSLTALKGVSICCRPGQEGNEPFRLPDLTAVVTDFPQEHVDPKHDIEGMLGMEVLSLFDVDFDFAKERLRFWKPATAIKAIKEKLVEIPAVVINETGLIGIRLISASSKLGQPILAFLDCGSSFSAMNWEAAKYFGLPPKGDKVYDKAPRIAALGIDGRPIELPLYPVSFSYAGEPVLDSQTKAPVGFESPPKEFKPFREVLVAIGDLPVFSSALGADPSKPFRGPAALVGLDVLSQRRVVLETEAPGTRSRRRRVWVSPS